MSRNDLANCTCLLVKKGRIMIFNNRAQIVCTLHAGDASVFDDSHAYTATAAENDTEVIIV